MLRFDDVYAGYGQGDILRGVEMLGGLWGFLDVTPLGRQEIWEDSPEGYPQGPSGEWVHRHDEY